MSTSYTRIQNRELSIFVGALGGILLSVFATLGPISNFGLVDLVIFLSIPILSGALASFSDPDNAVGNGVIVGVVVGLAYVVMAAVRLTPLVPANIVVFLLLVVPIWGFLAAAGSMFARQVIATTQRPSPAAKACSSCKTPNPPDALFCKNCGMKLG